MRREKVEGRRQIHIIQRPLVSMNICSNSECIPLDLQIFAVTTSFTTALTSGSVCLDRRLQLLHIVGCTILIHTPCSEIRLGLLSPHRRGDRALVVLSRVYGVPDDGDEGEASKYDTGVVHRVGRDRDGGGCDDQLAARASGTRSCSGTYACRRG